MPVVTVKLLDRKCMPDFYFGNDEVAMATKYLNENRYTEAYSFALYQEGEAAADEMFDLTNNPNRQAERERYYGMGRSISVGDIVEVNSGQQFVCCSFGWKVL